MTERDPTNVMLVCATRSSCNRREHLEDLINKLRGGGQANGNGWTPHHPLPPPDVVFNGCCPFLRFPRRRIWAQVTRAWNVGYSGIPPPTPPPHRPSHPQVTHIRHQRPRLIFKAVLKSTTTSCPSSVSSAPLLYSVRHVFLKPSH